MRAVAQGAGGVARAAGVLCWPAPTDEGRDAHDPGYRSLRDLRVELGPLNVVTGPNGSGKSSLYRALRLLAEMAQGRVVQSLAAEDDPESADAAISGSSSLEAGTRMNAA